MKVDLIIDANYILSKTVFSLHKNKTLFGSLFNTMKRVVADFRNNYPYNEVFFVSDSKKGSWRKTLYKEYKENRKKDSDIDWDFCYRTYDEFKEYLKSETRIKVLEGDEVEGDDWISFLVDKSNTNGHSTVIVTNDHDIKQMVSQSTNPLYINIIVNEMFSDNRMFVPSNYEIFLNKLQESISNSNIFDLNDDNEFMRLLNRFSEVCEIKSVEPHATLLLKMIIGDKGDNIFSAWTKKTNGRRIGIGETVGKRIADEFLSENIIPDLDSQDSLESLTDIIMEHKKIQHYDFDNIVNNLRYNKRLMSLNIVDLPQHIVDRMELGLEDAIKNANNFDRLNQKEDPLKNFNSDFKLVDDEESDDIDDKDFFNF